ncbi:MAG TPA: hypothetical protein P5235_11735 [Saprospiraceae bacterium]|nr:hypothetical protein [Lewinellaceae bacterium]HPK10570.1 hypothetical protein [Saprospiraceae bacterium]HRX30051.1 hypothetical protein [Saprospiraceae bacterium]
MNEINNFKELQKLQIEELNNQEAEESLSNVKNQVEDNVGTIRFIGDLIELYVAKYFDGLFNMLNTKNKNTQ